MDYRSLPRRLAPLVVLSAALAVPATGMHEEESDSAARVLTGEALASPAAEATEEGSTPRHMVLFVDRDGEVHEVTGEGESFAWITADSPHRRFRFHLPGIHRRQGGYLGVVTTPMTPELRLHFGAPEDAGLMISKVVDDSPALAAGLRVGDILTAVDGEPIHHDIDLLHRIRRRDDGESVSLDIVRDGKAEQLVAVLDRAESTGPGALGWAYRFDCDEDCSELGLDLCQQGSECRVEIDCQDDVCVCEVDGQSVECRGLPGPHRLDD